jgi:hypothetical protein
LGLSCFSGGKGCLLGFFGFEICGMFDGGLFSGLSGEDGILVSLNFGSLSGLFSIGSLLDGVLKGLLGKNFSLFGFIFFPHLLLLLIFLFFLNNLLFFYRDLFL